MSGYTEFQILAVLLLRRRGFKAQLDRLWHFHRTAVRRSERLRVDSVLPCNHFLQSAARVGSKFCIVPDPRWELTDYYHLPAAQSHPGQ